MSTKVKELTAKRLRELFRIDPATVISRWLVYMGILACVGAVAGSITSRGYREILICGRRYGVHCLAWFYMTGEWPPCEVDHINTDPSDNRWANLRLAIRAQNMRNSRRPVNNTSGLRGATWDKRRRKWTERVTANSRGISLGYFHCPAAAHFAYCIAAHKYHGEFPRAA